MQALLQQIIIKAEIHFFQKFLKNKTEIMTLADTMLACHLMDIIHLIQIQYIVYFDG